MPARKRARREVEPEEPAPPREPTKLEKLRNTWEFASLVQYIYIFGNVVKIDDDVDVEELEAECLTPTPSEKLAQIGLALLKYVSSHKGLTLDIFDEYARRQFVAKAPQRNPFGIDEEPRKFNDMDTFTKIRILQQLSTWTLGNADRIREKMPEQKDTEQTNWRVEAFGWDKEDRTYFVLDDDRLYRRTDPPLPPAAPSTKSKSKAKAKPKKAKGTRASKRRRLSTSPIESDVEQEGDGAQDAISPDEDTFGGMKWECIAVTLEDYNSFVESIRKSKDPNEKELLKRLQTSVLPIIEKRAEQQRQKALRKQRELENLEKLANAKRSTRIAGRVEKQKEQEAAVEAERKRVADLQVAKKEQEKQKLMEEARESRMVTREQRLKERQTRRILHEEELQKLRENSAKAESNEMRLSERHIKAEMERRQRELEQMAQEEENWIFDCAVCGVHGENLDDGSHSIACERCNVWQHSSCHGIAKTTAERDDFHFVCSDCKRKAEEAARPKLPPLKFKVGASPKPDASASSLAAAPPTDQTKASGATSPSGEPPQPARSPRAAPLHPPPANGILNGPSLSPHGQTSGPPGIIHAGSGYGSTHSTPSQPAPSAVPLLHAANAPSIPPPRLTASDQGGHHAAAGSPNWHRSPPSANPPYGHLNGHPPTLSSTSSPDRPLTYNLVPNSPASGYGAQSPSKPRSGSIERRPMSSGYGAPSPSKPAPASSSYEANGHHSTRAPLSSPSAAFLPAPVSRPAFSPVKQASSPPQQQQQQQQQQHQQQQHHSSPFVENNSHLLPEPSAGISPEKHDGAPPAAQGLSDPPKLAPVAALVPSADPPILTPPSKTTPESSQTEQQPEQQK